MYYIWSEIDSNTLIYMDKTDGYANVIAKIVDSLMRKFTHIRFVYDSVDRKDHNITQLCYMSYTKYGLINDFHHFVVEYVPEN